MAYFGLNERDMMTINQIFQQFSAVKSVWIFGSRATGSWKPGSDVDLVIMDKEFAAGLLRRIRTAFEESSLPYFVDLHAYTDIPEGPFRDHINRVGKPFYTAS